ncbi:4-alpha-glucanotransferase [Rhizobium panacihumi]|uniref:4-alpha-glucanotransferase n=1 Tax=Rhizobium panacihumi TaxID=2008450 RepID=UPI003D7916EC
MTQTDKVPDPSSPVLDRAVLDQLADEHGIDPLRPLPDGSEVKISQETVAKLLRALNVDMSAEITSKPEAEDGRPSARQTASTCFVPDFLSSERVWGVSLQLYELRSERNWGIGDFEDLRVMIDLVASLGGDFIGLNPLHAPFLADAGRCSPYEPSSRLFLNPLYIAVDRLPFFQPDADQHQAVASLRDTDLVAYEAVASAKLAALRSIWMRSACEDSGDMHLAEFRSFIDDGGEPLRRHALFEALSAHMVDSGYSAGWHTWPKAFQDPISPETVSFASKHDDEVRFHLWLQWITHRQLQEAANHARAAGLRIGLYLDLAVGEALDGSATWSERDIYLTDATIGSPPDPFAPNGQDWHLAGFQPGLIASGENPPFQRMVTAAMQYAGAIRIDHAAALRRLFLVPVERTPSDGAYVRYPREDLMGVLADTSKKYRCLVIGEDLGLLPDGLQDDLAAAKILSYRILSYEHDDNGFKSATDYPALALACISTHDHQTLAGWWRGADIALRAEHGIVSPDLTGQHEAARRQERQQLVQAIGATDAGNLATAPEDPAQHDLTIRAHRFVAGTPSMLVAVRLADLTDEKQPTNVPGTSNSYPNWQPKLSVAIEKLSDLPLVAAIADAVNEGRRSSPSDRRQGLDSPGNRYTPDMLETSDNGGEEARETDAGKLDAIVEKYADKIPRPIGRLIRWMRKPDLRWVRLIAGILFVLLGLVGFLPILGFWMVPFGLIILAQDSKWLQRPTLKAITWLERKFGC